jgi:hypothetical protein
VERPLSSAGSSVTLITFGLVVSSRTCSASGPR